MTSIADLALDPRSPQTLYAACAEAGLFKSVDGGTTWVSLVVDPQAPPSTLSVIVTPTDPVTVYAVAAVWEGASPRSAPILYRSADGGETWTASDAGLPRAPLTLLTVSPSDPAVLLLKDGFDVYKTSNGGMNWSLVNVPLYNSGFGIIRIENIDAIAVDPIDSSRLYFSAYGGRIGVDSGVYWSIDGGGTWNHTPSLFRAFTVATDPVIPLRVYAVSQNGPFVSTDGGATWEETIIPCGLHPLVGDRVGRLYCSASSASPFDKVWTSSDSGETWSTVGEVPLSIVFGRLIVDASGTFLYVQARISGIDHDVVLRYTRVWDRPSLHIERRPPSPRVVRRRP